MERGMMARMTRAFPQAERSKRWASTILLTSNTRLERILLHSLATSMFSPGIDSTTPSCPTGTRAVAKSRWAADAEPCCKKLTMRLKANSGTGTNHSKKHRGKTHIRKIRVPKQQTNDPIHYVTTANMLRESCSSVARLPTHHLPPIKPIRTAITIRVRPVRKFGSRFAFRDRHFKQIRATLMGRIRRMCVYASFRSANPSIATRLCRHRTRETAHREAKLRYRDRGFI